MSAHTDEHARLLRHVTNLAVVTAIGLAAAKLVAWSLSDSVALLASAVDSSLDVGASLLNALAVRYALKPADDDHRFGHGKSEALAGLAQAVLVAGSAGYLMFFAVDRLLHPRALEAVSAGIIVMCGSSFATLALVLYQRRIVRLTGSQAVKADSLHFAGDIGANLATIAGLGLAPFGWIRIDPVLGLLIAATTAYSAARIGWDTFQVLMDHELAPETQERIAQIAQTHPAVVGMHQLRTRRSGASTVIQFHLEMDGELPLREANRIAHEVSDAIRAALPGADVIIHQDPAPASAKR